MVKTSNRDRIFRAKGTKPMKQVSKAANSNGQTPAQAPAPTNGHSVGAVVGVAPSDQETILTADNKVKLIQRAVCMLRTDYLNKEARLIQELNKVQSEYETVVFTIGSKMGLNIGPGSPDVWKFYLERMKYERTA